MIFVVVLVCALLCLSECSAGHSLVPVLSRVSSRQEPSKYTGCFPKIESEMRRGGFIFFWKFESFCGFIGK